VSGLQCVGEASAAGPIAGQLRPNLFLVRSPRTTQYELAGGVGNVADDLHAFWGRDHSADIVITTSLPVWSEILRVATPVEMVWITPSSGNIRRHWADGCRPILTMLHCLTNPQSLNRYSYVGNRPLSFTDPRFIDRPSSGGDDGGDCIECAVANLE